MFIFAALANDIGLFWYSLKKLEIQTGISRKGLQKILPRLEKKQLIFVDRVRPGDRLPNGKTAKRMQPVYRLSEAVCGVPYNAEKVVGTGERSSPTSMGCMGEPSSSISVQCMSEPGTMERSTPSMGNKCSLDGELSTRSLHDQDLKRTIEKEHARKTAKMASFGRRSTSMICCIREKHPLDPTVFRKLVNEAIEDDIPLPRDIVDAVLRLEKVGRLERTKIGKIELVDWDEPMPLHVLLNGVQKRIDSEKISTLILNTVNKMEL